jgi:hypothetical protein
MTEIKNCLNCANYEPKARLDGKDNCKEFGCVQCLKFCPETACPLEEYWKAKEE